MLHYDTQAATPIHPSRLEMISRPYVGGTRAWDIRPAQMSGFDVSSLFGGSSGQASSGQASPMDFIVDIGKFFTGVFSKSPEKSEFDATRQQIWEKFAVLVDTVDKFSRNNQLSESLLRQYVGALQTLMENYYEYYQRMRAKAGAEWTDPRFRDFYDPMEAKLADWQYILSAGMLPETISGEPTLDPETGRLEYTPKPSLMAGLGDNLPLLLVGVAALFMFSRGSRGK